MRYILNILLICFCLQLSAIAEPNYTYTPVQGTYKGAPVMTNAEAEKKNFTGSYYDEFGSYHYDVSKADAKYQQITDDYFKKYHSGTTIGYNTDDSSYEINDYNCPDTPLYTINKEYCNSQEYRDLQKDIESHRN